ncbi:hypothetical protein M440DRAFT_259724 [Trichoderma longibrachiatum ATCC 18648]|uniref:Uncharacterized protein n=1 Tax=Trichoderma longibrachiatum ATCC 18648 TaxID=983965 RepID=A0A2T4CA04_TRILO|nr:hypothetical protein M440DRAFT_259724 [Trichoderma longibrachiatum ATCC 18648]
MRRIPDVGSCVLVCSGHGFSLGLVPWSFSVLFSFFFPFFFFSLFSLSPCSLGPCFGPANVFDMYRLGSASEDPLSRPVPSPVAKRCREKATVYRENHGSCCSEVLPTRSEKAATALLAALSGDERRRGLRH